MIDLTWLPNGFIPHTVYQERAHSLIPWRYTYNKFKRSGQNPYEVTWPTQPFILTFVEGFDQTREDWPHAVFTRVQNKGIIFDEEPIFVRTSKTLKDGYGYEYDQTLKIDTARRALDAWFTVWARVNGFETWP